jgi:hypothetical protein
MKIIFPHQTEFFRWWFYFRLLDTDSKPEEEIGFKNL